MATMPPDFDIDRYLKDSVPEMIARMLSSKPYSVFRNALNRTPPYPHFDGRGVYRYRQPSFFDVLTPLGRLQVLNRRARMKRIGCPELTIKIHVR